MTVAQTANDRVAITAASDHTAEVLSLKLLIEIYIMQKFNMQTVPDTLCVCTISLMQYIHLGQHLHTTPLHKQEKTFIQCFIQQSTALLQKPSQTHTEQNRTEQNRFNSTNSHEHITHVFLNITPQYNGSNLHDTIYTTEMCKINKVNSTVQTSTAQS